MEDIYRYLGKSFVCELCGRTHSIPVKAIKKGDVKDLSSFVSSLLPEIKGICLLTDNIVWEVIGKKCKELLDVNFDVFPHIIYPSGEKRVTARQDYIEGIVSSSQNAEVIITVGTGTITDLGKYAGDILKKPVISIPSAPSMNAYTSGVSALIKNGVKLTFSVSPAKGVFIDEQVLLESPVELIKAGFADSSAKAFANADWKLSSIITGEPFCELPLSIVGKAEEKYIEKGELLLKRDKETLMWLMEGLNLGGISMLIAGTSSPASGGEHLISHFLDMYSHQNSREPFAYHGLQVGTGVYISSVIYEYLGQLSSAEIKKMIEDTHIEYEHKLQQIKEMFPSSADIIEGEFKKKMEIDKIIRRILPESWDKIKKDTFPMVYKPYEVKMFLESAGCPVRLEDIGVDKALAVKAITLSRFIRGRLVILDIAEMLGILEEIIHIVN
ncbi:MAG: iron-containing alcohol dehydrogenase [bacterium]|nr:iron-containing alcohol dehydrogenase [bacterium]